MPSALSPGGVTVRICAVEAKTALVFEKSCCLQDIADTFEHFGECGNR